MNCLSRETLHALILDELSEVERSKALGHLEACSRCRKEARELLVVYSGLMKLVAADPCPASQEIEDYADGSASEEVRRKVMKHIRECSVCAEYFELMKASRSEAARLTEEQERRFVLAQIESRGESTARAILEELLPGRLGLFERVWEKCVTLFDGLSSQPADTWPAFKGSEQLTGAMGFTGVPSGEVTASVVISMTVLGVMLDIDMGRLDKSPDRVRRRTAELARQFGAGAELRDRMMELLPRILCA